jgi:hypothetical protein
MYLVLNKSQYIVSHCTFHFLATEAHVRACACWNSEQSNAAQLVCFSV